MHDPGMKTPRDRNGTGALRPGAVDQDASAVTGAGVSVLIADDDERVRDLIAAVLHDCADVSSVIEAGDGADAIRLGLQLRPALALLDLNMPRLDGVDVAITLRALVPSMRIALQSSDRSALRERAAGLDLPLFDKFDLDYLVDWVRTEAAATTADAEPRRSVRGSTADETTVPSRAAVSGRDLRLSRPSEGRSGRRRRP